MTSPDYLVPPERDPRIGVDRDAAGQHARPGRAHAEGLLLAVRLSTESRNREHLRLPAAPAGPHRGGAQALRAAARPEGHRSRGHGRREGLDHRPERLRQDDAAALHQLHRDARARATSTSTAACSARSRSATATSTLDDRALARQRAEIGMVFQRFNLFPHLTVLQNIEIGPIKVLKLPPAEARDAGARAARTRSGWPTSATPIPSMLSGGQQQRVAIARALAMQPEAHAVRRGDLGARPGAGRRGART